VRILFFGDLARTGFGTVTMDLGRALLDIGQDVRFISQNDIPALDEPYASRTFSLASLTQTRSGPFGDVLPSSIGAADFIPKVIANETPDSFMVSGVAWGDWPVDAALMLGDFGGTRLMVQGVEGYKAGTFKQVPTYHYCPVEGVDLPPLWSDIWSFIKPVAMSTFGADEMARVVGYRPPVVYHGVTEDFWPVSPSRPIVLAKHPDKPIRTKDDAKRFWGLDPRLKTIVRTDRNMPRKNYPAMIRSLVPIIMERDDVVVMLHCKAWDQGGFIPDTVSKFPKKVDERILVSDLGGNLSREILNTLYNAADLYVSTGAEGFGLTIAEALACGVPAIGLQYSAVPEVIGPAGMVVPVNTLTDNEYDHFWARPDEEQMTRSIAWMLDHPSRAAAIGALGPRHVRSRFDWKQSAERFVTILGGGTPDPYDPVPSADIRA
jgi:glycosyltransferase involved in cell wall biosynthesis